MRIEIPKPCVIALVGVSGSGKSTFAKAHFKPTEVLSSDFFRALIADDEADQSVSAAAFEALYYIADKRLEGGRLVVIDATNVQKFARNYVVKLAKRHGCPLVGLVFDYPEEVYFARNSSRPGRVVEQNVIQKQAQELQRSIPGLAAEGFDAVHVLHTPEEAEGVVIVRMPGK